MDNPGPTSNAPPPGRARDASGILAVRTGFARKRKDPSRRRKFPRPSSRTLLFLFGLVVLGGVATAIHRRMLDSEFETRVEQSRAAPFEIKRIRRELVEMESDEQALANALDARLKYLESARKNQFYISIDKRKRRFSFHFADKILRDAPVEVGLARTIASGKKSWTFAPLSGAFSVTGKFENGGWKAPEWAYRMNGAMPPNRLPTIEKGLGRYVIHLGNDYVIHSAPPPESPLKGAKPGSFLVPEADLAAIWPRIGRETRVYVF
jgi:hypothetical protein